MLHLLSLGPRSGYDIIRAIEEQTGGHYTPSAGVIYPTLTLLQDTEHIALELPGGQRNVYGITTSGQSYLAAFASTLPRLLTKMQEARSTQEIVVPDEVRAALSDLNDAIRSRLRSTPETDTSSRMVGLLNQVARQIRDNTNQEED